MEMTIKSLLIQMSGQEHPAPLQEQGRMLLHMIQGMQLQSTIETANLLTATLQLPGGKLSLNKDIFLQFTGQKDRDGNIQADHCRILFVLHLNALDETMIDMHVQQRVISLHIYNDQFDSSAHHVLTTLQATLKENLQKLDYHLSAVTWKPLYTSETQHETEKKEKQPDTSTERFDYKI